MNFTNQFLNIDLTASDEVLRDIFLKSICEIRSEELNVSMDYFKNHGDQEALNLIKKSSIQEICLHTDNVKLVENVAQHASNILENYNQSNSVTVFRGTRLPLSNSSFKNGYIHTTPHLATSAAYAVGISNSYGGIGRLLTREGDNIGLGFIHAYEAPLNTKIYKNFQFERFLNGSSNDSNVTLKDFKEELESFSKLEKNSFTVNYFSEQQLYGKPDQKINMSPNMQKWYDFISSTKCMDTPYYEVMLPEQSSPKYTFLIDKDTNIIKLDLNNSKTKKVLNKLQNLLLKDFYEINPLNKLVKEIEFDIAIVKETNSAKEQQNKLHTLLQNEALQLKELKKSVNDMIDKVKSNKLLSESEVEDLMNNSQMVGSTNMIGAPTIDSKISYPKIIEDFINDALYKKKTIERPLDLFLKFKTNLIHFDSAANVEHTLSKIESNNAIQLLDKLKNKITEKGLPSHLKLNDIDKDGVMLELMVNIENKLKIGHVVNPTIENFVDNLQKIKNHDTWREYCGKKLVTEKYTPFLQFVLNKTMNQDLIRYNKSVCI